MIRMGGKGDRRESPTESVSAFQAGKSLFVVLVTCIALLLLGQPRFLSNSFWKRRKKKTSSCHPQQYILLSFMAFHQFSLLYLFLKSHSASRSRLDRWLTVSYWSANHSFLVISQSYLFLSSSATILVVCFVNLYPSIFSL